MPFHMRTPLCAKWCAQQVFGGVHVQRGLAIYKINVCMCMSVMVTYRYNRGHIVCTGYYVHLYTLGPAFSSSGARLGAASEEGGIKLLL